MEENKPYAPVGLGGWLIWFQIRIYIGLASFALVLINSGALFSMFAIAIFLVVTLVLFYRKSATFRVTYIIATLISFISYLVLSDYYSAIGLFIVETIIIIALFKSKRVQWTFGV